MVVARAILGEWLGGSGGGWQDSGGIFPGVKIIHGRAGRRGRPRVRASAGAGSCPRHELLDGPALEATASTEFHEALAESLVLVHGGMAQNVGPILNMVTSKYLLRSRDEWRARQEALEIFEEIVAGRRSRATSGRWAA